MKILKFILVLTLCSIVFTSFLRYTDSNNCFIVQPFENGLNYAIKINPNEWYSTVNLSFKLFNDCTTSESMENVKVIVDNWLVNGSLANGNIQVSQAGSPWLTITGPTYDENKMGFIFNTPVCEGLYCNWAKVPSKTGHSITLIYGFNGRANTSSANNVKIDGSIVLPGSILLKVDSSSIIQFSISNTQILVYLMNASQQRLKEFAFNPQNNKGLFSSTISDLPVGTYTTGLDLSTLPPSPNGKITWTINPQIIRVQSNSQSESNLIFVYTPNPKTGNLSIVLNKIPTQFEGALNGVLNDNNQVQYSVKFTKNSNSALLNNLPISNQYQLFIPGIGFPLTGLYTNNINLSAISLNEGNNKKEVSYEPNLNLNQVVVSITGEYRGQISLKFSSNSKLAYQDGSISIVGNNNYNLYFNKDDNVSVKVGDLTGWKSTITPNEVGPTTTNVTITIAKQERKLTVGGYYQSWSASWASKGSDHSLSKIPSYITRVLVSFATPSLSYQKGSNTMQSTGLSFSAEFDIVKDAIAVAHRNNPEQKFILSVGGATYPWVNPNYQAMVDLMIDLGLDGIDIDYENQPTCTGLNTANVKCSTDQQLIEIIDTLKRLMPSGKLLSAAVFSVGAYGTTAFPNTVYLPGSSWNAMWVNPLKQTGNKMDEIYLMSYDASPIYSPIDAFNAYKSIYTNPILIGLEVPPEAWGGYTLTVPDALKNANYSLNNNGGGVFIWSLQKTGGGKNAKTFLKPICELYKLTNCDANIPLN